MPRLRRTRHASHRRHLQVRRHRHGFPRCVHEQAAAYAYRTTTRIATFGSRPDLESRTGSFERHASKATKQRTLQFGFQSSGILLSPLAPPHHMLQPSCMARTRECRISHACAPLNTNTAQRMRTGIELAAYAFTSNILFHPFSHLFTVGLPAESSSVPTYLHHNADCSESEPIAFDLEGTRRSAKTPTRRKCDLQ